MGLINRSFNTPFLRLPLWVPMVIFLIIGLLSPAQDFEKNKDKIKTSPPFEIVSREAQTNLLELYTSEGCSSCPPADTFINGLKTDPALFKNFIAVVFHVDYWNNLGWTDPYSQASFTQRQKDYGQIWQSQNIYTPEFALNGREWRHSGTPEGHSELLENPHEAKQAQLGGILRATAVTTSASETKNTPSRFDVTFSPRGAKVIAASNFIVYGALMAGHLKTHVTAGENAGADLDHELTVLDLQKETLKKNGGTYRATIQFKSGLKPTPESIAIWVTGPALSPVQAVGSDLTH